MLDEFTCAHGASMRDETNGAYFLSEIAQALEATRSRDALVHGLRTQAMFAHVVAALGGCTVVKEEDAGDLYVLDNDLRVPDFRIVTIDRREVLVEVKNHRPSCSTQAFSLSSSYMDSLQRYCEAFGREMLVAIYWSEWQMWTLLRREAFDVRADSYRVSFEDALKMNEMSLLGDVMIATAPPLALRLLADTQKPRRCDPDGGAEFTVGAVELLAAGNVVDDPREEQIAWFLMRYGGWTVAGTQPETKADKLVSFALEVWPGKLTEPSQGFEMIGFMSQMLSREYNELTADAEGVNLLTPDREPEELGIAIPYTFTGEKLRLWRFSVVPPMVRPDAEESDG